jgi:hypothetical protein
MVVLAVLAVVGGAVAAVAVYVARSSKRAAELDAMTIDAKQPGAEDERVDLLSGAAERGGEADA